MDDSGTYVGTSLKDGRTQSCFPHHSLPSLQIQAKYLTQLFHKLPPVPAFIFCIPCPTPHSEATLCSLQLPEGRFHLCAFASEMKPGHFLFSL